MCSSRKRRYAIISPVRNESERIVRTLESVVNQSEPPVSWVIVDDGSTDDTASAVREFAERVEYIHLLSLDNNNEGTDADRLMWAAEARAFNVGLREVDLETLDYVVKLDGDLAFDRDYFAGLLDEFERDSSLGIAGGHCYQVRNDNRELEWVPESHVRGATKMYRTACFLEIGGVEPVYGWDTLDELKAQMAGWRTRSFHPGVDHLKPTGSVGGMLRGRVRGGRGAYMLGYHPLFMPARCVRLAMAPPYVMGGLAFLMGYLIAQFDGSPRVADKATIDYLRHQQMQRLRGLVNMAEIRSVVGKDKQ
jgi:poly-beta-1,6-N-acetyl-D-glucosamine synthase